MRRAKRKLELTYNVIGRDDVDLEAHGPASAGSTDLRSMIMFGVNTLHKSDGNNDMEIVDDSQLGDIVDAALAQRGKAGSNLPSSTEFGNVGLVTLDSRKDQAENIYNFEGKDFAKVRMYTRFTCLQVVYCTVVHAHLNGVSCLRNLCMTVGCYQSQMWNALIDLWVLQPADKALLESWAVDVNASKENGLDTRRTRKGRVSALGSDEDQENARAQKRQKAEDKKHLKWQSLGYHSFAVDDPGVGLQLDSLDGDTGNDIHFVIGDCTQPVTTTTDEPCIILSYTSYH